MPRFDEAVIEMPAKSKAQQAMMGADLARMRKGMKSKTGMSEAQLEHFASTPRKGLPAKAKAKSTSSKKGKRA